MIIQEITMYLSIKRYIKLAAIGIAANNTLLASEWSGFVQQGACTAGIIAATSYAVHKVYHYDLGSSWESCMSDVHNCLAEQKDAIERIAGLLHIHNNSKPGTTTWPQEGDVVYLPGGEPLRLQAAHARQLGLLKKAYTDRNGPPVTRTPPAEVEELEKQIAERSKYRGNDDRCISYLQARRDLLDSKDQRIYDIGARIWRLESMIAHYKQWIVASKQDVQPFDQILYRDKHEAQAALDKGVVSIDQYFKTHGLRATSLYYYPRNLMYKYITGGLLMTFASCGIYAVWRGK